MKNQSFVFHGASQATFAHRGKSNRGRGKTFVVETEHAAVGIYISNAGRSIRIWDRTTGAELKPETGKAP